MDLGAAMSGLEELLERVKAAIGPDRQLDYALFCHFAPRDVASAWHPHEGHRYTTSIDAALALTERLGWRLYTVDASIAGRFNVLLAGPKRTQWSEYLDTEVTIPDYAGEVHSDFCLAILAATISALIAKGDA